MADPNSMPKTKQPFGNSANLSTGIQADELPNGDVEAIGQSLFGGKFVVSTSHGVEIPKEKPKPAPN